MFNIIDEENFESSLKKFINIHSLWNINISRIILLKKFLEIVLPNLDDKKNIDIAIIGGDRNEIELMFIKGNSSVRVFGVEDYDYYLDLNVGINDPPHFDLIICNQVIEHIWNINSAFLTFKNMLKKEGLLWITCPCSNMAHGSPEFYSAGYTHTFLDRHASLVGLKKISSGSFGSARMYFFQHIMNRWPTASEFFGPISFFVQNFRSIPKRGMLHKIFWTRIFSVAVDAKFCNKEIINTETYGLFIKHT
ncbi:class I SAM-dependent methyltransferase [Polynucleobacter asymbioticus]|nr:class I SAM-dependent methyltransferase [Polynucleobacter asymbioticus]